MITIKTDLLLVKLLFWGVHFFIHPMPFQLATSTGREKVAIAPPSFLTESTVPPPPPPPAQQELQSQFGQGDPLPGTDWFLLLVAIDYILFPSLSPSPFSTVMTPPQQISEAPPPKISAADLKLTGEEAFLRRQRMSKPAGRSKPLSSLAFRYLVFGDSPKIKDPLAAAVTKTGQIEGISQNPTRVVLLTVSPAPIRNLLLLLLLT